MKQKTKIGVVQENAAIDEEQAALERLRLSKAKLESDWKLNGLEQGRMFVLMDSMADEPVRRQMERADEHNMQPTTIDELVGILTADDPAARHAIVREFECDYGCEIYETEWVQGFYEGALSAFRELEHKLNTEKSV
jgi:hypothetical protein